MGSSRTGGWGRNRTVLVCLVCIVPYNASLLCLEENYMASMLAEGLSDNNGDSSQYSKVIELGQLTLKVVILINGGAALAVLTLIGSILSSDVGSVCIAYFAWALASFGIGILTGAVAVGMGYLSENHHFHQNLAFIRLTSNEEIVADMREKIKNEWQGLYESSQRHLQYAGWLVYSSYTLFGIGIALCTLAFLI